MYKYVLGEEPVTRWRGHTEKKMRGACSSEVYAELLLFDNDF